MSACTSGSPCGPQQIFFAASLHYGATSLLLVKSRTFVFLTIAVLVFLPLHSCHMTSRVLCSPSCRHICCKAPVNNFTTLICLASSNYCSPSGYFDNQALYGCKHCCHAPHMPNRHQDQASRGVSILVAVNAFGSQIVLALQNCEQPCVTHWPEQNNKGQQVKVSCGLPRLNLNTAECYGDCAGQASHPPHCRPVSQIRAIPSASMGATVLRVHTALVGSACAGFHSYRSVFRTDAARIRNDNNSGL